MLADRAIYRRLRRRFLLFFRRSWSAAANSITAAQKAKISPVIWSTKIKSLIKFKFIKFLICQRAAPVAALFLCVKASIFAVSQSVGHGDKVVLYLELKNFLLLFFHNARKRCPIYVVYNFLKIFVRGKKSAKRPQTADTLMKTRRLLYNAPARMRVRVPCDV